MFFYSAYSNDPWDTKWMQLHLVEMMAHGRQVRRLPLLSVERLLLWRAER